MSPRSSRQPPSPAMTRVSVKRAKSVRNGDSREVLLAKSRTVAQSRIVKTTRAGHKTGTNRWLEHCARFELDPRQADESTPGEIAACIEEYCHSLSVSNI
jgi:hypothetical protein